MVADGDCIAPEVSAVGSIVAVGHEVAVGCAGRV